MATLNFFRKFRRALTVTNKVEYLSIIFCFFYLMPTAKQAMTTTLSPQSSVER